MEIHLVRNFKTQNLLIWFFFSSFNRYRNLIRTLVPNLPGKLIKVFKLQFFPPELNEYFTQLVKEVVEYREKNNVTRNDFLNLLLELKNNSQAVKDHQLEEEDMNNFLEQFGDKHAESDTGKTRE